MSRSESLLQRAMNIIFPFTRRKRQEQCKQGLDGIRHWRHLKHVYMAKDGFPLVKQFTW